MDHWRVSVFITSTVCSLDSFFPLPGIIIRVASVHSAVVSYRFVGMGGEFLSPLLITALPSETEQLVGEDTSMITATNKSEEIVDDD